MRSCFAIFFPDFKSASQLREKAEASSTAENIFDRDSNGIVDALEDQEDILEMGGVAIQMADGFFLLPFPCSQAAVEIVSDLACYHFLVAAEVVADRFTLLSAHSRAPEQPSMIETAFLFLADSKTPNFKNELLCIPEYVKKSAK
ncbi:hypothetical protein V6N13_113614 [Hibiscus sabdariffa]